MLEIENLKIISTISNQNNIKFTSFADKNGIYLNSGFAIAYMSYFYGKLKLVIEIVFESDFKSLLNEHQELEKLIFPSTKTYMEKKH